MKRRILVADDMPLFGEHIKFILERDGFEVETKGDGLTALDALRAEPFGLLITDIKMPGMNGIELLETVRREKLPLGVIVLTGHGDIQVAVEAMKAGADDFLTKPFDIDQLRVVVSRVLDRRLLSDEMETLRRRIRSNDSFHDLVSKSPKMRRVFDLIEQVGPLGSTVLIHGETGTGKELAARALHETSNRRNQPLVALNCAAPAESLLETEMFGHEKGAFTGAERRKIGRFELAHRGAIFLDEIGEVSLNLQAKLLRVLQNRSFTRVGGNDPIHVDIRIIAATNKRLDEEVRKGRFRADLFHRINVVRVDLPPLRERIEDIPLLAMHFLKIHADPAGRSPREIDPDAMRDLLAHPWPGNFRELENAIKAAAAMSQTAVIDRDSLPATVAPKLSTSRTTTPLIDIDRKLTEITAELIERVERDYFAKLLEKYRGNIARCAKHSGMSRLGLTRKIAKLGVDVARFRKPRRPVQSSSS